MPFFPRLSLRVGMLLIISDHSFKSAGHLLGLFANWKNISLMSRPYCGPFERSTSTWEHFHGVLDCSWFRYDRLNDTRR
jgi:hypothetical protein